MKLVYWANVEGRLFWTRGMLYYHNVDFEDENINAPAEGRNGWNEQQELEKKGFIKPDLPYLEDGDVKLVESFAIAKYVARKIKCYAENEKDLQVQEQIEALLNAYLERIISLRWGPEGEGLDAEREDFKKTIDKKLKPVENLIAKNGGKWICGEKLTEWVPH